MEMSSVSHELKVCVCVFVCEITSHSIRLISAAVYAPIRSLSSQHILNKEKKEMPSLPSLREVHGKKRMKGKSPSSR